MPNITTIPIIQIASAESTDDDELDFSELEQHNRRVLQLDILANVHNASYHRRLQASDYQHYKVGVQQYNTNPYVQDPSFSNVSNKTANSSLNYDPKYGAVKPSMTMVKDGVESPMVNLSSNKVTLDFHHKSSRK
jgi:hypothetical protein